MDWSETITTCLQILAVIFLVLLNGFFVATEFALVKVRRTQLEPLAERGNRRARMALHLSHNLDAYLSACQLGITLASLGLGWIGEPVFSRLLQPVFKLLNVESETLQHSLSIGIGFSVITFLHIVAGEMAPKSLAIRRSLGTSVWVAYPMRWFHVTMYPFIWLLNESALMLLRWFGLGPAHESDGIHSEDELRLVLAASQKSLGASRFSRDIVQNALELHHRIARDAMRPRQELTVLDTEWPIASVLELAEKTRYSRYPICEAGDPDRTRGVIHIKDIYPMRHKAQTVADLLPAARKLIYVPETARLEKLLQLFLGRKLHMAIVVDEYGGTVGMLTIENILEEIVGQIQDEFDQEQPLLVRVAEGTWQIAGGLPLHELGELLHQPLHEEGISTTSGWITERLGGFPKVGDKLKVGSFELRVEELEGLRVSKLTVSHLSKSSIR